MMNEFEPAQADAHPFIRLISAEVESRGLMLKELGVRPGAYLRWFRGEGYPSLPTLEKVLDRLGYKLIVVKK